MWLVRDQLFFDEQVKLLNAKLFGVKGAVGGKTPASGGKKAVVIIEISSESAVNKKVYPQAFLNAPSVDIVLIRSLIAAGDVGPMMDKK